MRLKLTAGGLAVAAALAAGAASAGTAWDEIGRASLKGSPPASATGFGDAEAPTAMAVRVVARPRQRVTGSWSLICWGRDGADFVGGPIAGRTPFTTRMKLAVPDPLTCSASARAQLSRKGTIQVVLLAR